MVFSVLWGLSCLHSGGAGAQGSCDQGGGVLGAPAGAIPLVSPVSAGGSPQPFPSFLPFPSHRPLKVERGRKKSDPIPERRMEKKKGERATASHHRGEKREGRAPGLVAPSLGQGGISGIVPGSFPALL